MNYNMFMSFGSVCLMRSMFYKLKISKNGMRVEPRLDMFFFFFRTTLSHVLVRKKDAKCNGPV